MTGINWLRGRKIRKTHYGPGKYEACYDSEFAQALHNDLDADMDLSIDNGEDWYGFYTIDYLKIKDEDGTPIEAAILTEDGNGFVTYETYTTIQAAKKDWSKIEEYVNEYYKDSDDGLDDSGTMSISNIIIILVIILGVVIALRFMVKADNTTETRQIWMRPGTQSTEGPI